MSQYVSRTLAARRRNDRRNQIGLRVALCLSLLIFAALVGTVSYLLMVHAEGVAINTKDPVSLIRTIAIWGGILSFISLLAVPLVAAGLHETKR
jgi:hypothetical protein